MLDFLRNGKLLSLMLGHFTVDSYVGVIPILYPLLLVPMFARAFRTVGISVRGYAATLAPTLLSTGLMVLVVFGIRMLPQSPLAARFALEVACGAITFVGSAMLIQRRRLGMLADFVRTIRN